MKISNRHSATRSHFALFTLFTFLFTFFFHPPAAMPQVSVTTIGTGYTQNFDTLPASGSATWTNNSTIPGWYHARTGTGTTVVANDGSSNAGNLYSYGTGTATDRALGSLGSGNAAVGNLFWGVRLQNNTGSTITSLNVSYTGEQWRNSAAAAQTVSFSYLIGSPTVTGSLAEFQTAGVAVPQLDFTSPITGGTAGALNGNLAANRVTLTHTITGLNIPNGTEVMLRWSDPDHTGSDHGMAIDDFSVTPQGSGPPTDSAPSVSSTTPANNATNVATNANVSVTFSEAVNASSNSFQISCSSSGTHAFSLSGGPTTFTLDPTVDFTGGETCTVTVFAAQISDQDSIDPPDNMAADYVFSFTVVNNTPVAIHDIQGSGSASPIVGQTVTTSGIVTLLRTGSNAGAGVANGFFLQELDALVDADQNTSEGIFVFTSSVPTVAVGDFVTVTGTVVEFNGLTQIGSVTNVTLGSSGNPLPTPVMLTAADLDPTATPSQPQLEKYEAMRVGGTFRTVAPNDNFYDVETVLSTVARPLREPGIEISKPVPPDPTSGVPDCCIARFDENPERLKVDTNGRAGAPNLPYTSNVTFTNLTGPLDYAFSEYRLVADAAPNASANISAAPVTTPASNEFTVVGYNIENFNNNAAQRQKAALTIRTVLKYPDIIGLAEIFELSGLRALRDQINNDAVAAGDPNPMYEAYLIEGNGVSGDNDQDVGFLVKTSRVSVTSVTQRNAAETYINPNTGQSERLNDRPPLVLRAVVNPSQPNASPVIVIVNHLRSFIDIDLVGGEGPRVRAKRKAQAESLAALLQEYQTSDPTTPVISVGDYNAFEFSSGYDDSLSVIKGNPTSDDMIVVDQSPDLVNPDFYNLIDDLAAGQKYTFIFQATPQALDHVVVNTVARNRNRGIAVARVNADFPEFPASEYVNNVTRPEANSDHDPVIAYFSLAVPPSADLAITKTDGTTTATPGGSVTYTITASNSGPSDATVATVTDTFPASLSGVTWTCVGAGGATCTALGSGNINDTVNLPSGSSVTYTATASISASATGSLSNTATVSSDVSDPNPANNSATDTDTLSPQADLAITKTNGATSVNAGGSVTYTIAVGNSGPGDAASVTMSDTLPSGTTFVSLTAPNGWSCSTPAVGSGGTVSCSISSLANGANAQFTLVVNVATCTSGGTVLSNTAAVSSTTNDPNTGNNSATSMTTVEAETTPPVINANSYSNITVTLPANSTATSTSVTFPLPTATDNCGAVTVVTSPASGSQFPVGTTVVTITATDAAGNQSTATFTVTVLYRFEWVNYSDLLSNPQYFNQVTAGSNVPIRFTLSGYKGNPYSQPPTSQQISCSTLQPIGAATVIDRFAPDPYYSSVYDFYQTTWQTKASWRYTCRRLTLYLADGTQKSLNFYFK